MKILLTFNDGYAPHAAVVIESVIRNASNKVSFIIMYFENELTSTTQSILKKHFEDRVHSIEFYSVDNSYKQMFDGIQYSQALTMNTFLRLLASEILKEEIILYLDSDLIVVDDIYDLMKTANLSYSVNAVAEHYPSFKIKELQVKNIKKEREILSFRQEEFQYIRKKYLKMSDNSPYFNAGVMVMNLKLWREQKLFDKILFFLKSYPKLHSGDQDALNGVINGNFYMLPLWWNVHPYVYNLNECTSKFSIDELKHAVEKPSIIHFAGYKAWQYKYEDDKVKNLYWMYRMWTPWPDKYEQGKTIREVIRKKIEIPIKKSIKKVLGFNNMRKIKKVIQ